MKKYMYIARNLEYDIKILIYRILNKSSIINSLRMIYLKIDYYLPWNYKNHKKSKKFYSQFIKKGDKCFDVGANVGNYTRYFLKLKTNVICVEPQERCLKKLYERFNNNKNVVIIDKAVGKTNHIGELFICEKVSSISTMSKKWKERSRYSSKLEWNVTQRVEVITLDNLIDAYGMPSFCKIDVEGYEIEVLAGLTKRIPLICFEFHKELLEDAKESIKYLKKLGYSKFNFAIYNNWNFFSNKWLDHEELIKMIEDEDDQTLCGDIYAKF